jgi:2-aminoadipate transaminase
LTIETLQYASATHRVQPSALRDSLPLLSRPDVISLVGGFQSAAALDLNGLRGATQWALISSLAAAFQYGNSEAYGPLRELIAQRAKTKGMKLDASGLLVTTGSQQAIDLVTRVLVDPGDCVALEVPTYLGALQAFQFQCADVLPVPTDHEGVRMEELEAIVVRHRPKLLYLIPTFANPTGYLMSLRRRKQLLALAKTHRLFIVEDDAYEELYFQEPPVPSLFALANDEERQWVVHLASFSKILAPGLRLAWLSAPTELLRDLIVAKQLGDTHASTLSQLVAFHYLNAGSLEPALSRMRHLYENQGHDAARDQDGTERYAVRRRASLGRYFLLGGSSVCGHDGDTAQRDAGARRGLRSRCSVLRRASGAQGFAVVVRQRIGRADREGHPASRTLHPVGARRGIKPDYACGAIAMTDSSLLQGSIVALLTAMSSNEKIDLPDSTAFALTAACGADEVFNCFANSGS